MLMLSADAPLMSIVLTIDKSFAAHRKAIQNLNLQTGKARIEVILVSPLPQESIEVSALTGFLRVRCIRVAPNTTCAQAKAVGFQQAAAPIVAFTEDHSYPNPEWADALISAHEKAWAAVGPAVGNANPRIISAGPIFSFYTAAGLTPTRLGWWMTCPGRGAPTSGRSSWIMERTSVPCCR